MLLHELVDGRAQVALSLALQCGSCTVKYAEFSMMALLRKGFADIERDAKCVYKDRCSSMLQDECYTCKPLGPRLGDIFRGLIVSKQLNGSSRMLP